MVTLVLSRSCDDEDYRLLAHHHWIGVEAGRDLRYARASIPGFDASTCIGSWPAPHQARMWITRAG